MASLRAAFTSILRPRTATYNVTRAFASSCATRFATSTPRDAPESTSTSSEASTSTPLASSSSSSATRSSVLDSVAERLRSEPKPLPAPRSSFASKGAYDWTRVVRNSDRSSPLSFTSDEPRTAEENWSQATPIAYSLPVTLTTARSVVVKNKDVAKAYRMLNRVLMENNVRKELRRQERFEGPSDKRVRLDSERHRRRFKVEVGKQVGKALRLRERL